MRNKILNILTVFIFLFALNAQSITTINVDLNKRTVQRSSVAGFLHFQNLEKLDSSLVLLKPGFWRFGATIKKKDVREAQIPRLLKHDIKPIIVFSDLCGCTSQQKISNDGYAHYKEIITSIYGEWGNKIIYDIWNEPNIQPFWYGTAKEFYENFKIGADLIRSLPGGDKAIITGPSTAGFDKNFIEGFLKFCEENNVRVDILNWHQNGDLKDAVQLKKNIQYAKDNWLLKYKKVGIKDIYIPEIVGFNDQFNSLTTLAYICAIEDSGASGACHSCWENKDKNIGNTCWNNSIDGLLDNDGRPRPVWWLYKWYAESLENRLNFTGSADVLAVPYLNPTKNEIHLILGNMSSINTEVKVKLNSIKSIKQFKRKSKLLYKIFKLPNSSETLKYPNIVYEGNINISASPQITVNLPSDNSVYKLVIYAQ